MKTAHVRDGINLSHHKAVSKGSQCCHQGDQDYSDQHFHGAKDYFVKAIADFLNGCGCNRATPQSDGEPAFIALREAVENAKQSNAILENSPRGDSQSDGARETAGRETEAMLHIWKCC